MEDYLLEENNKIISDNQEITTIFNEYFTNIIEYTTGKNTRHLISTIINVK